MSLGARQDIASRSSHSLPRWAGYLGRLSRWMDARIWLSQTSRYYALQQALFLGAAQP
jgi:hypothetical protein